MKNCCKNNIKEAINELKESLAPIIASSASYGMEEVAAIFRKVQEKRGICACEFPDEAVEAATKYTEEKKLENNTQPV